MSIDSNSSDRVGAFNVNANEGPFQGLQFFVPPPDPDLVKAIVVTALNEMRTKVASQGPSNENDMQIDPQQPMNASGFVPPPGFVPLPGFVPPADPVLIQAIVNAALNLDGQ